jgi:putative addiction module component (TIGR02574 family)
MTDQVLELVERGRALAPEERARLVDLLVATLEDGATSDVADAWDREVERRIAAFKAGEVEAYDLEEVLAEARRLAP